MAPTVRPARVWRSTAAAIAFLGLPFLAVAQGPNEEETHGSAGLFAIAPDGKPGTPPGTSRPFGNPVRSDQPPRKRWGRAVGEVLAVELIPWGYSRYVTNEDFSHISLNSLQRNWHAGFGWDNDDFRMNQDAHPYHGSLYFNAARTNGFTFWESIPFAAAGSLIWEFGFENTRPSTNDFVNTTLGGVTRGEAQYRLSRAILDQTARGPERVVREVGAAVLNPVGFLNRLLDGEVGRVGPNPDDRLPESLKVAVDVGGRHLGGDAEYSNQAVTSFRIEYGDPHEDGVDAPFDAFVMDGELVHPGEVLVPRFHVRGILSEWDRASSGGVDRIVGAGMRFEYFSTGDTAFGGQGFEVGLLSRRKLSKGLELRTEAAATAFPVAGIQTDYEELDIAAVGRNYDYGPGVSARAEARLRNGTTDVATVAYIVGWYHTSNGISKGNRLQLLSAEGRLGLTPELGIGAAFTWLDRLTTYEVLPSVRWSSPSMRIFATWTLPTY